jgi:hypothetical protein
MMQASKKPPSQHLSSAILLLAVHLLHMCPPGICPTGICPQHKYITTFLEHVHHATFRKRKGEKKKRIGGFS